MTTEEFQRLHNFSIEETDIQGRPIVAQIGKIQLPLMQKIDTAVSRAKQDYSADGIFVVHCITLGKHSKESQHYQGKAIDGHFLGLTLYQAVMYLFKAGFNAIGIYPDWEHRGIHADIREQDHVSTWIGYYMRDDKGEFVLDDKGDRIQKYRYDFPHFMEQLLLESELSVDSLHLMNGSD